MDVLYGSSLLSLFITIAIDPRQIMFDVTIGLKLFPFSLSQFISTTKQTPHFVHLSYTTPVGLSNYDNIVIIVMRNKAGWIRRNKRVLGTVSS